MSRLVCACGTPIPRGRAGSNYCSNKCARDETDRERLATLLGHEVEDLAPYSELLPLIKPPASPGEGMMLLLQENPTLLDPAPADVRPRDVERRYSDQVHTCLRCGQRAQVSYVVLIDGGGNRWLDLCAACDSWMRTAA